MFYLVLLYTLFKPLFLPTLFRLDISLEDEEEDADAIIERRRKERQALLEVNLNVYQPVNDLKFKFLFW